MIKKHLQNPEQLEQLDAGWRPLVFEFLKAYDELTKEEQTINTVKEKFGLLRIYSDVTTDAIRRLIETTEAKSETICGDCGSGEDCERHTIKHWVRTLCRKCALARDPTGDSCKMPRLMFKTPFMKLS